MASKSKVPTPITVLVFVIIIAAIATWLLPAGEYDKLSYNDNTFTISNGKTVPCTQHTLDSLHIRITLEKFKNGDIRKPVAIPGTYHQLKKNGQGPLNVSEAPIKGIYDTVDIIFFILIIGGFITIFNQTGAMEKGMAYLSHLMKGKEAWLIVIVTFFFTFCGSAEGMAEEGLVFYPILVPLFLAAGYDLLVPVAVIFAGCNIGNLTSFSNPFSTIIASNAAGINWADGLNERIVAFLVTSALLIWYIVRYAERVKKDPTKSFVYQLDGNVQSPFPIIDRTDAEKPKLGRKNTFLLILFFGTIFTMIGGVLHYDWWLLEMTTVFLVSSVLIA
ncbi:MAG TPA: SLC13 family permease, partial [Mucilaginibacter sp.]|nr:SLC13 family permease [Mucilaginibacter sp.]